MTLREMIQDLAEDIASSLLQELKTQAPKEKPGAAGAAKELAEDVGKEVAEDMVEHLLSVSESSSNSGGEVSQRMAALEGKVKDLVETLEGRSQGGQETNLPNLKYAKSKYKNVESLLNYIENKEADGGIKLVIMNFND